MQARSALIFLFGLLVPCCLLSLIAWDQPDFLISSDTLLPAEFVWDVLHHSYAWLNFQQARVPSFVPDLLIYAPIQAVTGSWRIAMAAWVLIVLVWLGAIASCITVRITRSTDVAAALAVMLLVMLVLSAALFGLPRLGSTFESSGLRPYLYILPPFDHGGPFLLALTAALIAHREIERALPIRTVVLSLISFSGGISDLLWFTAFLLPLTASMAAAVWVGTVARRAAIRLLVAVWASGILGWACAQMLDREPLPLSVLYTVPARVMRFLTELGHNPGMLIVVACFGLAVAGDAWRRGSRGWLGSFWSVFATSSALGSLALTMLLYEGVPIYRYGSIATPCRSCGGPSFLWPPGWHGSRTSASCCCAYRWRLCAWDLARHMS